MNQLKQRIPQPAKSFLKSLKIALEQGSFPLTLQQLNHWEQNGFLILKSFFKPEEVQQINRLIDDLWAHRKDHTNLVIDAFLDQPGGQRLKFKDAPDEARLRPYKLNELFLEHKTVRQMVANKQLSNILNILLDGTPLIFNGLSFEKGSQQGYHFDTFYMPPPIPNKMCASWIALETVSPKAGPLGYYPGSHKIPPYIFSHGKLNAIEAELPLFYKYMDEKLKEFQLEPKVFCAEEGDVFIWHAQLYHCGLPIEDMSLTRKSLVTHYFRVKDYPPHEIGQEEPGQYYLKRPHLL